MGRDWTPRELYVHEQIGIGKGWGSLWELMENTRFQLGDGESVPLYSAEEIALRKQFPVLGKLMGSGEYGFMRLYERLERIEGGITWLQGEEAELAEYIGEYIDAAYVVFDDDYEERRESGVVRWFEGELDKGFYYRDENDRLLVEYILDEAFTFSGKQNEQYIRYIQAWYGANGITGEDVAALKEAYELDVEKGRFVGSFRRYEQIFGYDNGECPEPLEKLVDSGAFSVERDLGKTLEDAVKKSSQTISADAVTKDERCIE